MAMENSLTRAVYDSEGEVTELLLEEARNVAADADVAIVFAGLPDSYESEGFDRSSLEMLTEHNQLIEAVSSVQPEVVVLINGSAITMPWADRVKAIVEGWLRGQAGGGAIADVITGRINRRANSLKRSPSGSRIRRPSPSFPQ
jgi:beta-glucosidase